MAQQYDTFDNLDGAGRVVASLAARSRWSVYAALGGLFALSWAFVAVMAIKGAAVLAPGTGGPGQDLLATLPDLSLPVFLDQFFRLCLTSPAFENVTGGQFFALVLMWFFMSVAMMLPSAAPMVRTYCEIADTARAKQEDVVDPAVLVTGYLSIWLAASIGFAILTIAVQSDALSGGALEPARTPMSAAALAIAGLYQFSGFKDVCLRKCRNPFSILFARWSTKPARIFRLGAAQGTWCLGCCWALMLVMFAVGIMNVFWMALLAIFTVAEKQLSGHLSTRLAGALLLVWSAALLLSTAW